MKTCLIVKTSSLGDILHTLPALTEAKQHEPNLKFDWVIEKSFAEIPRWHEAVDEVIEIEIRKWRKNIFKYFSEIRAFKKRLKAKHYDYVIDAQGLLKSAWITKTAKGIKYGLDKESAREPAASFFYNKKLKVEKAMHAIIRVKYLFAKVFGYESSSNVGYGIKYEWSVTQAKKQVVFLHATTWSSKHWALSHWQSLAKLLAKADIKVLLPWGNEQERKQANLIAHNNSNTIVLEKMQLSQLAELFSQSQAVVAVDTGLAHLAAACGAPVIGIYGSTSAKLTGALGKQVIHLSSTLTCSPCLKKVCPITKDLFAPCEVSIATQSVYDKLMSIIQASIVH
ncbi:lipopolysaccharide heptosyltransferase I [Fastidiosibacter lacustris]|uniref:lipopolysaccharide heptosyltransferase I n=1 Tax=Fastidiosibacter lacustris TaxID=2056695 RepID=UPI000E341E98|nr:lipopolysaccharide heptosyltransferase I [Fastidiosibacter lacustris]